jgi:HK97 family phage major capsid protein
MRGLTQINGEIAERNKLIAPLAEKVVTGTLAGDELTEFRRIKGELETLYGEKRDVESAVADAQWVQQQAAQMAQPDGRSVGAQHRSAMPGNGQQPERPGGGGNSAERRFRSIGEAFYRSPQFEEYRRSVGRGQQSAGFRIGSTYRGHRHELADHEGLSPEAYALITTTVVTDMIEPQRRPDLIVPDRAELSVRDLFPNGTTTSNTIEFVREDTRTNNAAEVAEATNLTSGLKPESGFTLTPDSVQVRTVAHLMYATRTALDDWGQLRTMIDQFLLRGIDERVDRQLLLGDGIAPNIKGLLEYPVQVADAAYWTANPLPADANKWDRLRRMITLVRITGRGRATGIVMSPELLEEAAMAKDLQGQYLFPTGGPFANGVGSLWGLAVTEQEDLAAQQAIVGDYRRGAAVFDRMDAQIFVTDSNRDLFERNIITFLGEARLAFPVYRPEVFVDGVLA